VALAALDLHELADSGVRRWPHGLLFRIKDVLEMENMEGSSDILIIDLDPQKITILS
jgi:hypothetical protein